MSQTTHTAGPWNAFYKAKYDEWHVSVPISGSGMKHTLFPDGLRSENREADARLIAAAPELLAALKETLEIAIRNEDGDFAVRARAALSKAQPETGATP